MDLFVIWKILQFVLCYTASLIMNSDCIYETGHNWSYCTVSRLPQHRTDGWLLLVFIDLELATPSTTISFKEFEIVSHVMGTRWTRRKRRTSWLNSNIFKDNQGWLSTIAISVLQKCVLCSSGLAYEQHSMIPPGISLRKSNTSTFG